MHCASTDSILVAIPSALHRAFVVAKDELAAILARMEALQGAGGAAA